MVRVNTWLLKDNDFEKQMAVLFTWTWVKDRRESGVDDGYLTQGSCRAHDSWPATKPVTDTKTGQAQFLSPATSDRDGVFHIDREGAERSTERDGVLTHAQRVQHQVIASVDARVE